MSEEKDIEAMYFADKHLGDYPTFRAGVIAERARQSERLKAAEAVVDSLERVKNTQHWDDVGKAMDAAHVYRQRYKKD